MAIDSAPAPSASVPPPTKRIAFPGWSMLAIAGAAQFMSAPGQSYSVAAFKDPMRNGLGLSETDFSLAYGFATVISACLLPLVGRMIDRFGARVMLPSIAALLGGSCVLMSRVDSLSSLYIAFSLVRSLGQGALWLVSTWIVGEWFERRRGMATAIAGIGGGLSVMIIPLWNNWMILNYSWQAAWMGLALAAWGILIFPSIIFLRDRPEDIGCFPDGIDPSEAKSKEERPSKTHVVAMEDSWSVREVIRDATFWKLLSVPVTSGLVGTGLVFHQVALLGSRGISSTWSLALMSVQAGFALGLSLPAGWATDRYASRHLLLMAMVALASATSLIILMPVAWLGIVYALLLGVHGSILRSTGNVVWINYYGRANQGAVRGVAWSFMILAAAIGPLPLAYSIDQFGSYVPALILFLSMPVIASLAVLTAYPPQRSKA